MEKIFNNHFSQESNNELKRVSNETEKREEINEKVSEKAIENLYSRRESYPEKNVKPENLLTEEERAIKAKLEEEVNKMKSNPFLEEEARKKVEEIKSLKEREKLKYLLKLASEKSVYFAVKVAQKMKDPYTLDMFHDILAMNKMYERFSK